MVFLLLENEPERPPTKRGPKEAPKIGGKLAGHSKVMRSWLP